MSNADLLETLKTLQPYFEGEHDYDHPHCKMLRDAIQAEEARRAELAKVQESLMESISLLDDIEKLTGPDYEYAEQLEKLTSRIDSLLYGVLANLLNSTAPVSRERLREIADKWANRVSGVVDDDGNITAVLPEIQNRIYRALCEATGLEAGNDHNPKKENL